MSEKVIQEFQIIETDEGFRIELKGDKEMLRKLLFHEGAPFMPFGRGRGGWRFGGHGHGPEQHLREHLHEAREQHLREAHEHMHPPFEGRERPSPEELHNQRFFFQQRLRHGAWRARGWGYDMGPWWDEDAPSSEEQQPPV